MERSTSLDATFPLTLPSLDQDQRYAKEKCPIDKAIWFNNYAEEELSSEQEEYHGDYHLKGSHSLQMNSNLHNIGLPTATANSSSSSYLGAAYQQSALGLMPATTNYSSTSTDSANSSSTHGPSFSPHSSTYSPAGGLSHTAKKKVYDELNSTSLYHEDSNVLSSQSVFNCLQRDCMEMSENKSSSHTTSDEQIKSEDLQNKGSDQSVMTSSSLSTSNNNNNNGTTRRKNATRESTAILKAWLNEHMKNPYPTKGEKIMLAIITKMTLTQVSTWFANARRRLKKENKMTWIPKNRSEDSADEMSDNEEDYQTPSNGSFKRSEDLDMNTGNSDSNNNTCSSATAAAAKKETTTFSWPEEQTRDQNSYLMPHSVYENQFHNNYFMPQHNGQMFNQNAYYNYNNDARNFFPNPNPSVAASATALDHPLPTPASQQKYQPIISDYDLYRSDSQKGLLNPTWSTPSHYATTSPFYNS